MNTLKQISKLVLTPQVFGMFLMTFIISSVPMMMLYTMTDGKIIENLDYRRLQVINYELFIGPDLEKSNDSLYTISNVYTTLEEQKIDKRYDNENGIGIVDQNDIIFNFTFSFFFYGLFSVLLSIFIIGPVNAIRKVGNMEKRSKQLQKLGVGKFVQLTSAMLIHSSSRGNYLYTSSKIIDKTRVKFLVYQDASTDRQYVKYVPDRFNDADEAQAWSLSMSLERYKRMSIEA